MVTALMPLPRFYNPDRRGVRRPVEDRKFVRTAIEISKKFRGCQLWRFPLKESPRGYWWDRGIVDRDILALVEADIPDTPDDREWLEDYARRVLLKRFRQKAIYIKFVGPVETVEVIDERLPRKAGG